MEQFGSVFKSLCFDFHSYFFNKMTMLDREFSQRELRKLYYFQLSL